MIIIDQMKSSILHNRFVLTSKTRNLLFGLAMVLMLVWLLIYTILVQDIVRIIYG